jgi:hypothetical protein
MEMDDILNTLNRITAGQKYCRHPIAAFDQEKN